MQNDPVVQQILDRTERRIGQLDPVDTPTLKVLALPESVGEPVIQPEEIYDLHKSYAGVKRVSGGVCIFTEFAGDDDNKPIDLYTELNEYGVVYYRRHLYENSGISYFINGISNLLKHATTLYNACGVSMDIRVHATLNNVFKEKLEDNLGRDRPIHLNSEPVCYDSKVCVSTAKAYDAINLDNVEHQKTILEELTLLFLWAFNVPIDADGIIKYVGSLISENVGN